MPSVKHSVTPGLIAFAIVVACTAPSTAHATPVAAGGGLYLDTEFNLGLGANFVVPTEVVLPQSRLSADLQYFFGESDEFGDIETSTQLISGNVDAQNLFFAEQAIQAYGLAGLNLALASVEVSNDFTDEDETERDLELGINLGAGAEYAFSTQLSAFGEAKLTVSFGDIDTRLVFGAGIRFYFDAGGSGGLLSEG